MTTRLTSLAAALLLGAGTIIGASPAFGHASQVDSSPTADEVLSPAPSEVTITFDSALLDMGAALVVRDKGGSSIVTGDAVIDDRVLSVAVDPSAPAGVYEVAYRVVSVDGHTVEGAFTYSVEGAAGAAEPSPGTGPSAPPTPAAPEDTEVTTTEAATPITTSVEEESGGSPVIWIVGVGLVVIVGVAGALLLRR
jgi:methionine-rich copper-binding protein CopC